MGAERLSQEEVALVLRRAAELDAPAGVADELLPLEAVEAAAEEVGLPAVAVRQAVAELRAGLLPGHAEAPSVDPATVVEAAVVPLEPDVALDAAGRWLAAQTFERHRGRDGVQVWRPREDWVAAVHRRFDWSASVRLRDVRAVVLRAVAVEGGTLLRFEATLTGAAAVAPGVGAGAGAVAGGGAGLVATEVALAVSSPWAMAAGAVLGGLGAFAGWRVGHGIRRNRAEHIADELGAELDRMAAGGSAADAAHRRLRARVRRSGVGRWV
jgi:hypothetical protein